MPPAALSVRHAETAPPAAKDSLMSEPPTPGARPEFEPSQPPLTGLEQPDSQPASQQLQPVLGPAQQAYVARMVLVGVIAGALGIGLGAAVGAGRDHPTTAIPAPTVTVTATVTATTTVQGEPTDQPTDEPTEESEDTSGTFTPHKTDFQIGIKILQKTCLGSASCSISFRIEPTYVGSQELPSTGTVEVTYSILGAEDPIENSYLIVDGQASYDKEEVASTSSSDVELSAQVIDVTYTK
jgi:hypothetical protein